MHIHIVGVAGTGMAALAGLLVEAGHRVSGSDVGVHPPMGPRLEGWGVRCLQGFCAENLQPRPDLVVVGNVCRRDNPEARAALDQGLSVTHVAGALQRFALPGSVPLVVAGTHGKTTTASLTAWIAERVGLAPGFFIGGVVENFGRGFRLPKPGSPMVLEGDEYDTAFFEKSAKFLHYQARHAILTSIEYDHVDIYPTAASYEQAFERFIAGLPSDAVLVANAGDPRVRALVEAHAVAQVHWYGPSESSATWTVNNLDLSTQPQRFEICQEGRARAQVTLPLLGKHNAQNALAACVALHRAFDIPLQRLADALETFAGSKRRQELLGTPAGVFVYDDFAHHPTAVRETLAALRARHPHGKLVAAFEPRSATACRTLHQADYALAFDAADLALLAPVARAELPADQKLDTAQLARALSARGVPSVACASVEEVQVGILEATNAGDAVALLSNGTFGGIHAALQVALSAEFLRPSVPNGKSSEPENPRGVIVSCVCGLGESTETCCLPIIKGTAQAKTAEALMRSRYSAYVLHEIEYLLKTVHPDSPGEADERTTEAWSKSAEWKGLQIVSTEAGTEKDELGMVEFIARFDIKGVPQQHHERGNFKRHNKKWMYLDGDEIKAQPVKREAPRVGRNDPCPCGSGKKFKKCYPNCPNPFPKEYLP